MKGSVGAVVLAAGQSRRMGQPKLVLPWGEKLVIQQVVGTLQAAGVTEVVVVTGGARALVEAALEGIAVRLAHNPRYASSEMLASLQAGIPLLPDPVPALLVALGDQPALEVGSVRAVLAAYAETPAPLIVPSYQMRRGHPWLVTRSLWPELLTLPEDRTLRDFLNGHAAEIHYVPVDSPGILKDLDTPEDYASQHPR